MKFLHIADLHIGKRYNELSLIDDQRHILGEIYNLAVSCGADGVIIAGDIYDKSAPSAEAVELFDWFLSRLNQSGVQVFAVSGNHDSAERVGFGSSLMSASGVYFSPVYNGEVRPCVLNDEYGKLNVYLLPFIKPAAVRRFFEEREITNYTQALQAAVEAMNVNTAERNLLVAHQFVTGSRSSGSEEFAVGDIGNVDVSVFEAFDYVALGHVHGAQNIVSQRVRYSGTPLKYSLSEAGDTKSATIIELKEKGDLSVTAAPLKPMREMVEIRGTYEELTKRSYYEGTTLPRDLVHVVLTDEEEVPDALGKLRIIYPEIMSLKYDNARTRANSRVEALADVSARSPYDLFCELYSAQNNRPLTQEQSELITKLIEKAWGDER